VIIARDQFIAMAAALTLGCCSGGETQVVERDTADQPMNAATEAARETLPRFFIELKGGDGDFSLKVPVRYGREVEHVWISDVQYASGKFTGRIANKTGSAQGIMIGDSYTVSGGDISGWMIERDGAIYGGYTVRAMLDDMPREQAAALRARLRELN
jgi:uncharacterized protein YegJ (DUF2314 family)